ncbi:MAG: DUF4258 domain-containing protein [Leptospiraceae bacterium]|nr:DUF4258 domain-containing protein [Leptospiraceae bacterium]MCP5497668.1 DUF4258 domain-containing protein [Leptospiraceae bacterium]
MSLLFNEILHLVAKNEIKISEHGYDELMNDSIYIKDILDNISKAIVVEEYPDYPKGACVLVLENDNQNRPIHVLWGIPKNLASPAVLITAYRPDPNKWSNDFTRRKP